MKKEEKRMILIFVFLIVGCILGYFVANTQIRQFSDPEYIAFWTSKNMPVPKPLGYPKSMISLVLLFSGIPTGLIFYTAISKKWLTPLAPKIFIGFITFPIYLLIGVISSIPFLIYQGFCLYRSKRK